MIGPIDIFFDIRSNAESIAKENLYTIESFEINFDGARCANGRSIVTGKNPQTEQSIICTFDMVKPYNLTGVYNVKARDGTTKSIPIVLPSIEVTGLADIRTQENSRGKKIVTLDATGLKRLGNPRWIYQNGKEVTDLIITETVTSISQAICLRIFENTGCDRIFLLKDTTDKTIDGTIVSTQDSADANTYTFSFSGLSLNINEIINIEWVLDNQNIICNNDDEICQYTFTSYGTKEIRATIETANGDKHIFTSEVIITEPLSIVRHVKVMNADGNIINNENTYDTSLKAYILKNSIIPPDTLTFDARDIVPANPGFILDKVLWKISTSRSTEEKI